MLLNWSWEAAQIKLSVLSTSFKAISLSQIYTVLIWTQQFSRYHFIWPYTCHSHSSKKWINVNVLIWHWAEGKLNFGYTGVSYWPYIHVLHNIYSHISTHTYTHTHIYTNTLRPLKQPNKNNIRIINPMRIGFQLLAVVGTTTNEPLSRTGHISW